ncbi:hypothetical protein F442_03385, partial [Phytophthora nicotianae P10297]
MPTMEDLLSLDRDGESQPDSSVSLMLAQTGETAPNTQLPSSTSP